MLTQAFTNSKVPFDRSMGQIDQLLAKHGVREKRHTHIEPDESGEGRIIFEFMWPSGELDDRRGVRLTVRYQPLIIRKGRKVKGTTPQMGARALYWLIKGKFDSIDYGIEEFEVAFMPHLVTAIGSTFAEEPHLIDVVMERPEDISLLGQPGRLAIAAPAEG